jgi:hypothetical protein
MRQNITSRGTLNFFILFHTGRITTGSNEPIYGVIIETSRFKENLIVIVNKKFQILRLQKSHSTSQIAVKFPSSENQYEDKYIHILIDNP